MAITLADAVVFLKGDDSQLEKTMSGAEGKVGSFVGGATKLLGGALVGGAFAAAGAIAGIGVAAFNVASDTAAASNDIAASLGIPIEEAERFGEVAKQVFRNNFAGDVREAGAAVAEVAKQLGLAADDASLQGITEDAFRLKDAFGVEVPESIDAVKTLMSQFGLTADEAFDFVAGGFQKGLDRSGDFLDTIGEYSTQFKEGGADAGEFFSVLESGMQGGMLGTDKAADLFKEFRVRIQDGSKTTGDALASIGLDADEMAAKFADGSLTAADAFTMVQDALRATGDKNTQFQAGVALLGTQFEDLGADAALSINSLGTNIESLTGSADAIDQKYANLGDFFTGLWRRAAVAVSPLMEKLLELANDAMPAIDQAFTVFEENVVPAIEQVGSVVSSVVSFVSGLFQGDLVGGVTAGSAVFEMLRQRIDEIMPYIQTIITTVLGAISAFWGTWGETIITVVGNTLSIVGTAFSTGLDLILQAVKLVLQVLTGDWSGAFQTLQDMAGTLWAGITSIFSTQLDSLGAIFSTGLDAMGFSLGGFIEGATGVWTGFTDWWSSATSAMLDGVMALWESWGPSLTAVATAPFEAIQIMIETTFAVIQGLITAALQLINGDFEGAGETLNGIVERIWTGIGEVFTLGLDTIGKLVGDFDLAGAGRAIIDSLKTGISENWEEFTGWFGGKLQGLRDMLPFSEPKDPSSPLRNLSKAGRGITEQIQRGLGPLDGDFLQPIAAVAGAGGGGGPITIMQNFYGPTDPEAVRKASNTGVLDALRARGGR